MGQAHAEITCNIYSYSQPLALLKGAHNITAIKNLILKQHNKYNHLSIQTLYYTDCVEKGCG